MDRYLPGSYLAVFFWGIAVLLGMIGLGRLAARVIGSDSAKSAGWGLHAVWGASLYLLLGALLATFGLCGEGMITLLIVIGLAAMFWTSFRGGLPTRAALARLPWGMWPAAAVATLKYAGGVCWQINVSRTDDLIGYYNLCEKLLQTGSFPDPFSWRRLASLGGQTLLQCSILVHAPYMNAQAFETALGPVILLGLILGFRRGALSRSRIGVFIALVALTTPIFRVNTASAMTGVLFVLGLFCTLDLLEFPDIPRFRLLAAAGLVAGGLCSFRAQYVPAACAVFFFYGVGEWVRSQRPARAMLAEGAILAASLFLALLPWMIMALASNGTPLFPLFQGDNNLAFNPLSHPGTLVSRFQFPMEMLLQPSLTPLFLCMLSNPDWRKGLPSWAVSLAACAASIVLAYSINFAPDEITVPRFVQPILFPAALAALMTGALSPRCRMTVWITGAILIATSFPDRCHSLLNHYNSLSVAQTSKLPFLPKDITDYRDAQSLIPEDRKIFVCCDYPLLFDHGRNPIWNVDLPYAAAPAPGMPFKQPPGSMKQYLRGLGVDYVIFGTFDDGSVLYSRKTWQGHAAGNVPLYAIQAPFFLDFFDTMERLPTVGKILGVKGRLTVLQLSP